MKKKTIKIPIYGGKLTIICDKDLSYLQNKYKTRDLSNYGAVTMRDDKNYKNYIVAFECYDNSLIAHEVVHLINYIFLDTGVELDRHNDESQAYLTGWIFKEIENFLNKVDFY
jgi:hypothetical protein